MDTNTTDQNNEPKQSSNPMIIGIVVIGVLLLVVYSLFANKGVDSSTQVVSTPTSFPISGDVKEFTMTAKTFEFSPTNITVKEGDNVKLTINTLDVPHGFSIDELGIKKDLPVGTTIVEFTASKKGTFRFYCSLFCGTGHKEMEGQLIVE